MIPPLALTLDNVSAAGAWGFNCGPASACAILGMTPDEVRPHFGESFESKRYTNPTLMSAALRSLAVKYRCSRVDHAGVLSLDWPAFGLARIQWGGPWTDAGVPIAARYRKTHWVATAGHETRGRGVFDINCLSIGGGGWTTLAAWKELVVPWILRECVPRASGSWWITHALEIQR